MWIIWIIVILIVIGLIFFLVNFIKEHAIGVGLFVVIAAIIVAGLVLGGPIGLLIALGVCFGIFLIVVAIGIASNNAETNKITQQNQVIHDNDMVLQNELNQNCRWLGYMNAELWRKQLPNYANKQYSSSFDEITRNFSQQLEEQVLLRNGEWFQPFMQYICEHRSGSTVIKMLSEVKCPQFQVTHVTPNRELLLKILDSGTKAKGKDVKALFETVSTESAGDLYVPTRYLLHQRGMDDAGSAVGSSKEISLDDL